MRILFGSVVLLFFLLAIGDIMENKSIKIIAGYEGIICGSIALYIAMAQLINETYGKIIMPLGTPKK